MNQEKMPMIFVGHGSPMNAIEDNKYTRGWREIAKKLPKPKAILAISAHWYTKGTRIQDEEYPKMIYDMYGFPKNLYEVVYPARGSAEYAQKTIELIKNPVIIDNSWGLDHGTWSVLVRMYPGANIPVYQLSIDGYVNGREHFEIGKYLKELRNQGVLILASGDVVHNLGKISYIDDGFTWAEEFDSYIKESILDREFENVVNYEKHELAELAVPTPDHFYPLLYTLGACDDNDEIEVFNEGCLSGSLSMTSYLFK